MLEILKAVLFGLLEGVTEWLPVSSTGHLILLDGLVQLEVSPEFREMFDVVIQLGAILAVPVLFFRKLVPGKGIWPRVLAAMIPSGILGVLLDDWLDLHFYNRTVVSLMLIGYGAAFLLTESANRGRDPSVTEVDRISYPAALAIGAFQCLSLIPGTSRSGATILGAMLLGIGRSAAAEFSFFLAIPTMLGASGLKLGKFLMHAPGFSVEELTILLTGAAVSFLVSLLVIRGLMDFVRKHTFTGFGYYRIALGILVLLLR